MKYFHTALFFLLASFQCAQAAELTPGNIDPDFGDQSLRMGVREFSDTTSNEGGERASLVMHGNDGALLGHQRCTDYFECTYTIRRIDQVTGDIDPDFLPGLGGKLVIEPIVYRTAKLGVDDNMRIWLSYSTKESFGTDDERIVLNIRRWNADGSPDAGFGDAGEIRLVPDNVTAEFDEAFTNYEILVAGDAAYVTWNAYLAPAVLPTINVAKVTAAGIDAGYPAPTLPGAQRFPVKLALDSANRLVMLVQENHSSGYGFAVYRFLADGGLDAEFGNSGSLSWHQITGQLTTTLDLIGAILNGVIPGPGNTLLVTGILVSHEDRGTDEVPIVFSPFAMRLLEDGTLDNSFGGNVGPALTQLQYDEMVQALTSISLPGGAGTAVFSSQALVAARGAGVVHFIDSSGQPLSGFGDAEAKTGPLPMDNIWAAALDAKGGILYAGFDTFTARLRIGRLLGPGESRSVDLMPDTFELAEVHGIAPGECVDSESVTLTGIDTAIPVSVENGYLKISAVQYTGEALMLPAGQTIAAAVCVEQEPGAETVVTLKAGEFTTEFRGRTQDWVPDTVAFPEVSNVEPGVLVESAEVLISGFDVPVSIGVGPDAAADVAISVDGAAFTTDWVALDPSSEHRVRMQLRSSSDYSGEAIAELYLRENEETLTFLGDFHALTKSEPASDPAPSSGGGGSSGLWMLLAFSAFAWRRARKLSTAS